MMRLKVVPCSAVRGDGSASRGASELSRWFRVAVGWNAKPLPRAVRGAGASCGPSRKATAPPLRASVEWAGVPAPEVIGRRIVPPIPCVCVAISAGRPARPLAKPFSRWYRRASGPLPTRWTWGTNEPPSTSCSSWCRRELLSPAKPACDGGPGIGDVCRGSDGHFERGCVLQAPGCNGST